MPRWRKLACDVQSRGFDCLAFKAGLLLLLPAFLLLKLTSFSFPGSAAVEG